MMSDLGHRASDRASAESAQLALDWTLDPLEARVLNLLQPHLGEDRAIKIPALAARVGIGKRKLQEIIRRLVVDHGSCILSGGRGIWMAATADELTRSYREQRRKGISTLVRQRQIYRRHLARLMGQQEIAA